MMYFYIKRLIDFLCAFFALVFLFPLLVLIWVAVKKYIGGNVFFVQERPGLNGIPFKMVKFRTMTEETGEYGCLLPDENRLTPFGRLLRASSMDELPELWNVLRGDMSLVGPRPLLVEYLPLYDDFQKGRHNVRPGITGWAQVNGRNEVNWDERFKMDVWYVKNCSLMLDFKIIVLTFFYVLRRKGISASGHATVEKFQGNKK